MFGQSPPLPHNFLPINSSLRWQNGSIPDRAIFILSGWLDQSGGYFIHYAGIVLVLIHFAAHRGGFAVRCQCCASFKHAQAPGTATRMRKALLLGLILNFPRR
ncbi:hypothetical protein I7I50_07941 [Histoplasma capsulatum G186AR]|uniref:Uncharacterized protein n=1 Tax=Ajellomyces capsulatus TaxID=5037 RepID=A0A8H8CV96_AJECA|nr:hypothetical protein I7I52_08457 [Histoplasma capsulatum]QSS68503.1 hypothetical protein I7I50_07941 [Histoplasma capsulatum G186AR]